MATTHRLQVLSVKDQLQAEPYNYEFHQAIKILESSESHLMHLGEAVDSQSEVVTLSSRACYVYPASDVYSINNSNVFGQYKLAVNFIGLAGANAPLPMPYTELLIRRNQQNDTAFQDFIDIFNHRLLSIFHRIRKKNWVNLENCSPQQSRFSHILNALNGLKSGSFQTQSSSLEDTITYSTIHYWRNPRSSAALQALLTHYFQVPVVIKSYKGRWYQIDNDQQTRLGRTQSRLGCDSTLGLCYWDQRRTIQIQLGPLLKIDFQNFLPNGKAWPELIDMTNNYLGMHCNFEINLKITGSEMESVTLGNESHLGWNTWLGQAQSDAVTCVALHD